MTAFTVHNIESAPDDAKPILTALHARIGFVPNLAATMADSPPVLKSYATLSAIFGEGSFSPVEREIIAMTTSYDNQCSYCMAVHSTFAKGHGASDIILSAIRTGDLPDDPRLAALVHFTHQVVRQRGHVSIEEIQTFLKAGFTQSQALEVLIGVSQATLASFVHSMANTTLDEGFQPQKWSASTYSAS